jgi:hypothetical protein
LLRTRRGLALVVRVRLRRRILSLWRRIRLLLLVVRLLLVVLLLG